MSRAFSLVGVNSYNFGHLLGEFLPKLLALRGRPGFGSVPILVDEQMPPQHREAIELFAERGQSIVVCAAATPSASANSGPARW